MAGIDHETEPKGIGFLRAWYDTYQRAERMKPWTGLFEIAQDVLGLVGPKSTEQHLVTIGSLGDLPFIARHIPATSPLIGTIKLYGVVEGGEDRELAKLDRKCESVTVTFSGGGPIFKADCTEPAEKVAELDTLLYICSEVLEAEVRATNQAFQA